PVPRRLARPGAAPNGLVRIEDLCPGLLLYLGAGHLPPLPFRPAHALRLEGALAPVFGEHPGHRGVNLISQGLAHDYAIAQGIGHHPADGVYQAHHPTVSRREAADVPPLAGAPATDRRSRRPAPL